MRSITAAIEFGTSKIICVIGRARSMGRFEVLGSGEARYDGIKSGRWRRPSNVEEAVAKALYNAEKKARKRVKEAYIGVPGVFCKVVCQNAGTTVKSGVVTKQDVGDVIAAAGDFYQDPRFALAVTQPVFFMLDDNHHYIDVIGSKSGELSGVISFVMVAKRFVEDTGVMLGNLNVKPISYIPEMLAESMFLIPAQERDCSAVLLNVGFYDTNITVVYGDAIVYNKTIHAGGMQIASDLSIVLNMDVDLAEQIKKRFSFGLENTGTKLYDYAKPRAGRIERFSHAMVSEVIEARVEHFVQAYL